MTKPTNYYSLDVIISVGYRVKSQRGTQFRRWATSVLRDYLLKGASVQHPASKKELEDLETRLTRQVAEIFKESGFIEKYGSGIKRVIRAFAEMNLPKPDFVAMSSGFKVVVYGKTDLQTDLKTDLQTDLKTDLQTDQKTDLKTDQKTDLQTDQKTDQKTDLQTDLKTDQKTDVVDVLILQTIEQGKAITISEMAKRINKGLSATKARLTRLKQAGYIERIGSDKSGYWKVKTDKKT